ncbi:hypothetical protein BJI69_13050 [Luteibacter rhizovicinus DSM 16549]|uniref:Uncharacterized protein n=1 Tax=Luteibacter rhizovicinus DSM 16549 TaxID=1440763 RepID=A0A1L3EUN3_9GAMM|nr:hypothetical protein [Luteibacter rhizovicinus]APG04732.1 hypothetical protein BJI69_13050 [Luteibacter rhizovicinus DSM 16549]
MNLRMMWTAAKFSVVTCGIFFAAGLIVGWPRLFDAAFSPYIQFGAFALGLVAAKFWNIR